MPTFIVICSSLPATTTNTITTTTTATVAVDIRINIKSINQSPINTSLIKFVCQYSSSFASIHLFILCLLLCASVSGCDSLTCSCPEPFSVNHVQSACQCAYLYPDYQSNHTSNHSLHRRAVQWPPVPPDRLDLIHADPTSLMDIYHPSNQLISAWTPLRNHSIFKPCKQVLMSTSGVIYSPNYPLYYSPGTEMKCEWIINPKPKSAAIELNFQTLQLSYLPNTNCSDQLTIEPLNVSSNGDWSSKPVHFFGSPKLYPKQVVTSNGAIVIRLQTCDLSLMKKSSSSALLSNANKSKWLWPTHYFGFLATFRAVACAGCGIGDAQCAEMHRCSGACGRIISINYPLHCSNNHRCRWLITAPSQHYINVTVDAFDVPSELTASKQKNSDCMFDHVSFIDPSTNKLIGRYCNSNLPPKFILSAWNQLLIEFNSDSNVTGRGFSFKYQVQKFQLPDELIPQLHPPDGYCCPVGWSYYNHHCYKAFLGDQILQWYDAEGQCSIHGAGRNGHLVSILDSNEMSAVFHFLLNIWKSPTYKAFYIGLVDNFKEGSYRWSDQSPMAYTDWAPAQLELDESEVNAPQPDGGAFEDCTIIKFDFGHSTANWHDIPCSLGSHRHVVRGALLNNSDLIDSYICKMKAQCNTHLVSSQTAPQPMYRLLRAPDRQAVFEMVVAHRYFICQNLEVISFLRRCDGNVHCSDGSDEVNCPVSKGNASLFDTSASHVYRYEMNEAESEVYIYDHHQGCLPEQFRCANGRCISISMYCDFANDCGDNSDESSCEHFQTMVTHTEANHEIVLMSGCRANEFRCNNGECIPAEKRCDLLVDCKDESDEGNVCSAGNHCNRNSTFQCYFGNCIPLYAVCDRHRDCPGKFHEDEHRGICQQRMLTTHTLSQTESFLNNSGYVEKQSTEVLLNHMMFDRLAACRQSKKRTCLDLFLYHGANVSGKYDIKPENEMLSFSVYCLFPRTQTGDSVDKSHIRTLIAHDSHTRMLIQSQWPSDKVFAVTWPHKPAYHVPSALFKFSHSIEYDVGLTSIRSLQSDSKRCWQHVRWHCIMGSPLFERINESAVSLIKSGDNQWTSFPLESCSLDGRIQTEVGRCRCAASGQVISFRVSNRTQLPVSEVRLVSATNGAPHQQLRGLLEVSALECQGDSDDIQSEFEDDCKDISHIELFECQSGQIIKAKHRCILDHDQFGYQVGCRDVTQLRNCEKYTCSDEYVKCPNSYCIPPRYICDGKWDCVHGEDEIACENFQCPGRYRCIDSSACIYLQQLCDGVRQCPRGDDEWFCDVQCPAGCTCVGLYVSCTHSNRTGLPVGLSPMLRKLDLTANHIGPVLSKSQLIVYARLGALVLRQNRLQRIQAEQFLYLRNLFLLDLRENHLLVLESRAFAGLTNVQWLFLGQNPSLYEIEPTAFVGLRRLRSLNISYSDVRTLHRHTFVGLKTLQTLELSHNQLDVLESGAFEELKSLKQLDLRGNSMSLFRQDVFEPLKSLQQLYTDSFKFCCLVAQQLPFEHCLPQSDEISDCEDLMSSPLQRSFLWILGFAACMCNFAVVVWRFKTRTFVNAVSSTLVLSLGCADFLMGIYLLIIAIVDQYYRGRYIEVSDIWRRSALCKFCGVLSTLSTEASVFTLVFITLDRLICIAFPFSKWKFSLSFTHRIIVSIWSSALICALLPIFFTSYFKDEFYSRSGVCLALHITNKKPAGWEYSVALFLAMNLLAFLFIVACYTYMYKTIKRSSRRLTRIMSKEVRERQVGVQMAFIVMTNFCCWFPIIVMGFLALFGHAIPASVYSWTAVFILPVNSAVNPIIYTLAHFRPQLFRRRGDSLITRPFYPLKHTGSYNASKTQGLLNRSPRPPPGFLNLLDYLRENRELKMSDLLQICYSLSDQIRQVHASGYALGRITFDTVFISTQTTEPQVYLPDFYSYRVTAGLHGDHFATDMEDFGLLVKKMLQVYHSKLRFGNSLECRSGRKVAKNERKSEQSVQSARSASSTSSLSHNLNLLFAVNVSNGTRRKKSISADQPSNQSASSQAQVTMPLNGTSKPVDDTVNTCASSTAPS